MYILGTMIFKKASGGDILLKNLLRKKIMIGRKIYINHSRAGDLLTPLLAVSVEVKVALLMTNQSN